MKLYTKKGDSGRTNVIGGRVDKDDSRVEAYGTVDELNCFVGQAITQLEGEKFQDILTDLERIQHELFDCGADLATIHLPDVFKIKEENIQLLEAQIDKFTEETPPLERFILPGGTSGAATIHIARTVTRRAERLVFSLKKEGAELSPYVLAYLNRLSDYFFALARVINFRSGIADIEYNRGRKVFQLDKKD